MYKTPIIPDKKRMQWLDVSRVLCMQLIIYMHFPPQGWGKLTAQLFIASGVPFYLFWAGYFCAGNIAWKKIFSRCSLFFCVYFIWESLAWFLSWHDNAGASFWGLGQVFVVQTGGGHAIPYIGPLWFIRDLFILTLLTPMILKIRIIMIPLIFLFMSYQSLSMPHEPDTVVSIGTCLIYMIGCYLRRYNVSKILEKLPNRVIMVFLICVGIPATLIAIKNNLFNGDSWATQCWNPTLFGYICGSALISVNGILVMRFAPKLGSFIAAHAPAMLFVLILHIPLGSMINIQSWLPGNYSILQAPILMVISMTFYYLIKKMIPWAMPYITATR